MAGTHGDLFAEIGKLVVAAHAGKAIDLDAKAHELANRYWKLGLPPDSIAKAIARSLGAIGVSMELVGPGGLWRGGGPVESIDVPRNAAEQGSEIDEVAGVARGKAASIFPSGVRVAVLS